MLTEIPRYKRFATTAALLLPLACLAISIGCGSNSEPSVASKTQNSNANTGSQIADQIAPEQPTTGLSTNNSSAGKSADLATGLGPPTGLGDKSSKPKNSSVATKQATQNEAVSPNKNNSSKENVSSKTGKKYTDQQLHKNHTTLLLGTQSDLRARQLLRFVSDELTDEQTDQALKLILKEDYNYQRLSKRRKEVLNQAIDGDQTQEKLRQIKIETVELSNRLRALVVKHILTPEQKKQRQIAVEKRLLEKAAEAAKAELKAETNPELKPDLKR